MCLFYFQNIFNPQSVELVDVKPIDMMADYSIFLCFLQLTGIRQFSELDFGANLLLSGQTTRFLNSDYRPHTAARWAVTDPD